MQTRLVLWTKFSLPATGAFWYIVPSSKALIVQVRNRRAALEGLARILDAGAPEELFTGPDEDAVFLYDLLIETGRSRSSSYYWEICRTARRRGVTPDYVVDRALVLLASMRERQRTDLYRILGVPPLASSDMIRQRWLDLAKQTHPDTGGDSAAFRHAKEAYEILRDPMRRAEYEKFWLRALGPFERVAGSSEEMAARVSVRRPAERAPAPEPRAEPSPPPSPEAMRTPSPPPERAPEPAAPPTAAAAHDGRPDPRREALRAAAGLFAWREGLDRRLQLPSGGAGLLGLIGHLEQALGSFAPTELGGLKTEADRLAAELELVRQQMLAVATLKRRLGV